MSERRWSNVSYLDAIRPEPGWHTECAFLASYSADLVALVAAILALAGVDDDRGSGSKVDFANAVDQLKDRVRLVCQSGRLIAPTKTPKILSILDRYVREVSQDETTASWHPKLALVKLLADDGMTSQWRLWIGSRNLTRDLSWDTGLALIGRTDGAGNPIAGIAELGASIALQAMLPGQLPNKIRSELKSVQWSSPSGCTVHSIHLLGGTANRNLPLPPNSLEKVIVVSPFLDGTVVGLLGKWGSENTHRLLVSTRTELGKLANQASRPLKGFADLLYLDSAGCDQERQNDSSESENTATLDEEPEPRGLHAKIIYAQGRGEATLWTGSANATQRGWLGPNTELVAEMKVTREVGLGLETFVTDLAKTVRLEELTMEEVTDETDDRLELARKQVASRWSVVQRIESDIPFLASSCSVHPDDTEVELNVGLLGCVRIPWPRDITQLQLPRVAPSEVTEFVVCHVCLRDRKVSWLQRAAIDPPPGDDRDRRALARYLDPRTFLLWIRSLLTGDPASDGGGDWDRDRRESEPQYRPFVGPTWWAPTIEEVLKAWSRNPESLQLVDRKVRYYLKLYEEQVDANRTDEEKHVVDEFHKTWQILRRELVRQTL
jgi:hypothetical protein